MAKTEILVENGVVIGVTITNDGPFPGPRQVLQSMAKEEPEMSFKQSVILTEPQMKWLQKEADRLGIGVSELIRRIVDERRENAR